MIANNPGKDREILVTGAGGFIGRWVVRELTARGCHVRALVGPGDAPLESSGTSSALLDVRQVDLTAHAPLDSLVQRCDTIVHLAGPASVSRSFSEPADYARVHVCGTIKLLDCASAQGVQRVVYISSAEVYGRPQRNPVAEDHPLEPRSPYAAAKAAAECFVAAMAVAGRMQAVIIRPFSVYGPGLAPHSLIGTIMGQAICGEPIRVADLRPVRDYCYVADLASAIARACDARLPESGVMTVNIGTGVGTSVANVAARISSLAGTTCPVEERAAQERPAGVDILELVADCRRARECLDWQPATTLHDGLQATLSAQGTA